MATARRHLGRMNKTDQRLIIAFLQIPERENHALVIASDSLPNRLEQYLMGIVESREGQAATDLATVLDSRLMPDGSGISLLRYLHNNKMLHPVHVDNITMFPLPSHPFPLREVLEKMGRYVPEEASAPKLDNSLIDVFSDEQPVFEDNLADDPVGSLYASQDPYAAQARQAARQPIPRVENFNPHAHNQAAANADRSLAQAANLLAQAADLEQAAAAKREEAYQKAPQLRPVEVKPVLAARAPAPPLPIRKTVAVTEVAPTKPSRRKTATLATDLAPAKAPRKATK
jgi:hypothetical protein